MEAYITLYHVYNWFPIEYTPSFLYIFHKKKVGFDKGIAKMDMILALLLCISYNIKVANCPILRN